MPREGAICKSATALNTAETRNYSLLALKKGLGELLMSSFTLLFVNLDLCLILNDLSGLVFVLKNNGRNQNTKVHILKDKFNNKKN